MIKDIIVAAQKTPPAPPVYFNEVWVAGQTVNGELGQNTSGFGVGRSSPVQVGTDTNWSRISAFANLTHAIKTDDTLWAWGNNQNGQIGDNTTISRSSPVQIGTDTNWKFVISPLGLKTDGTLWSWGRNLGGELGQNDTISRSSPTQIGTGTDWAYVNTFALGGTPVAIKSNGTLWVWGASDQAGLSRDSRLPELVYEDMDYTQIRSYSNFSMGAYMGYGIGFDGKLWGWGANTSRILGDGTNVNKTLPVQIGIDTNWSKIYAGVDSSGNSHNFSIKTDDTLWTWGTNTVGQLGLLDTTFRSIPVQVGPDTNWKTVSQGESFTIALKTNGTMWAWGRNTSGNLAQSNTMALTATRSSPVQIGTRSDWTQISSGASHTIAIRSDGTLWAWGNGGSRQLGITTPFTGNRSSPTQVGVLSNWSQVAAGRLHSMAIASDGTLWTWGGNASGQLGSGLTNTLSSPTQVGTRSDWTQISARNDSSFGIRTDGTLWSWGLNTSGQLGLGVSSNRSSPTQVGTLTNWASASMGTEHVAFMNQSGVLYTAGGWSTSTFNSKLGIGRAVVDETSRSSPIQVGTDTNWDRLLGQDMAVKKTDGTSWAFLYRSSPIQIGTDTDWSMISCDAGVPKFGIKTNGTLWQWTSSALTSYSQSFGTSTDWKNVSYNKNGPYAIFTKTDGTLWFWGNNSNGQGGLGDTIYRSSPIQVGTLSSWVSASAAATHIAIIKRYT